MEIRYSPDPARFGRMTTEELRASFLVDTLFVPDAVPMVYSDIDRSITGSAVPVHGELHLAGNRKDLAAEYFLERRELGVINIGGEGVVSTDREVHALGHRDGLYVGRGTREVRFASRNPGSPARFYFVSYPAHAAYPAVRVGRGEAEPKQLGSQADANRRTIFKYFRPPAVKSCQLVMGLTELDEGSVWNTMPVHTHRRRSEIYMYLNVRDDAVVVHFLGEPTGTKHIVVRDGQAVISPSWSIHSGVGTKSYSFIWAMGGENQEFDDMDWVEMGTLR